MILLLIDPYVACQLFFLMAMYRIAIGPISRAHAVITTACCPVEFKKCPCHYVNFRG